MSLPLLALTAAFRLIPQVTEATQVAATGAEVCVAHRSGAVSCLPRSDLDAAPRRVGLAHRIAQLRGEGSVLCGLAETGEILCWGEGFPTVMGKQSSALPVHVGVEREGVDFDIGLGHACVRRKDGTIRCFGSSELGGGVGSADADATEHSIPGKASWLAVSRYGGCAPVWSVGVECWGAGSATPFGAGKPKPEPETLVHERMDLGAATLRGMTIGEAMACVLETSGAVRCFELQDAVTLLPDGPLTKLKPVASDGDALLRGDATYLRRRSGVTARVEREPKGGTFRVVPTEVANVVAAGGPCLVTKAGALYCDR